MSALPTDLETLTWLRPGRTAVITGGADGIGLAMGLRLAQAGMNLLLADIDAERLAAAVEEVRAAAGGGRIDARVTDVSDADQVEALRDHALETFGDVALVMNNAGIGGGGDVLAPPDRWRRVLGVNLMGVIHGVQAFTQTLLDQDRPAAIINTGSKQGITAPPGDTAYNVSKAGVKTLTEGLEHTLRNQPGAKVRAHLLVPGFTFTGITRPRRAEKPPGAWSAGQVVDFALERMAAGDFYILCPDNEVSRALDNARIAWAAQDLTENRPPLSRWHPDWREAFAAYLAERGL
jgi:NAD(P)-dependent dehydrogenase (short-subunit alcohol dehydrogenase family)